MALPFSRNTTYAVNSQVLSADLNDMQDKIVDIGPNLWDVYHLSSAFYSGKSFSVAAQESGFGEGLDMSEDGTKMYMCGSSNATVYQYTLSIPFDASTGVYASKSKLISEDSSPTAVRIVNNGLTMFVLGASNNKVFQYTLGTAYDVSTASYDSLELDVSSENANPIGLEISPDGTKLYMSGITASAAMFQYTLSTAFSLTGASYASKTKVVSGEDTNPRGISVSEDGVYMIMVGAQNKKVYRYVMATPFDVSTAVYDGVPLDVPPFGTTPADIVFSLKGNKMYILDTVLSRVFQYYTSKFVMDD